MVPTSVNEGPTASNVDIVGVPQMLWSALAWTAFWVALFYLLAITERRWGALFPESTKEHENNRYWSTRNLIGILHALVIAVLAVPTFFVLAFAPTEARFCWTNFVGMCEVPPQDSDLGAWSMWYGAIALAGMAFTTFTLADVFISVVHGLATWDFVAHHIAFITAGTIIRSNCMLPYNASILLAMEVSTPFLNVMLYFRHRGETYASTVQICGSLFFVLFFIFRIVINTYGAVYLWIERDVATPEWVPEWQLWFLLVAVTIGALVQFFWFPQIAKIFVNGVRALCRGENISDVGDAEEDEDKEHDDEDTASTASSMNQADVEAEVQPLSPSTSR